MPSAPSANRGFSPLDEELELWAGHFTPSVCEGMTRLGTWMPFERAVKERKYFWHVIVTEPTLRRQTTQRRREQCQKRRARRCEETPFLPKTVPIPEQALATPTPRPVQTPVEAVASSMTDKPKQPWRPAANHPWRRPVVLKTKRQLAQSRSS